MTGSSFVAVLCQPELATVEQSLHLLIGNSFLMDYFGNVACLPEVYYKCSNTLFALVKEGSERRKTVC